MEKIIMARKLKVYICEICGKEFNSRVVSPSSCSKECKSEIYKKIYNEKFKKIRKRVKCENCEKEITLTPSKIKESNFCSKKCYDEWQAKDGERQLKIRKKISNKLSGVSLRDRGFREESISKWVNAGRKASVMKCKGKKLEEIVGEEKALEIRKNKSIIYSGKGNPFYGKHHNIMTKNKIVENRKATGYIFSCGYFLDILWQSSYELSYLIYCFENNIEIRRFDLDPIEYYYQNKIHHYFPDFIQNNELIVEYKGWINGKELAKRKAAKEIYNDKYIIIDNKELNNMNIEPPKSEIWEWYKRHILKYHNLLYIVYTPYESLKEFEIG
jgi:hypothetical protein